MSGGAARTRTGSPGGEAGVPEPGGLGIARARLAAGAGVFLALTAGAFAYQFGRSGAAGVGPVWAELRWPYLALLVLCVPAETLASAWRLWTICRVLAPAVGFWTCVKAECANVAISLLTPFQSGGGPGQVYVLSRGGTSPATAMTVSLLSFAGTMVALLAVGIHVLGVAGAPPAGPLLAVAAGTFTAIGAVLGVAAVRPALVRLPIERLAGRLAGVREAAGGRAPRAARRHVAAWAARSLAALGTLVDAFAADVRRFVRLGGARLVWVCVLSLGVLLARALLAYACLRFLGAEASTFAHVLDAQLGLTLLVFFAPTPGGAGIVEGASLAAMAAVVPPAVAPHYTLLWRCSSVYLAAVAGFACLGSTLACDAHAALRRTRGRGRRA